ncbi:hypothetical protein LTR08_004524 [Meristemomyces frigidus]|nr:hypothetical protein LTR08_004524 [Meristemomyces frigidus]
MGAPTAESKPKPAQPPPSVVAILQTQPSQLYAHLHPVLLLSLVFFSFAQLVNHPVNTLLRLAPVTAILQAIYCVVCLPSTGQIPHQPGQKKKTGKSAQGAWAKVVPTCFSFVLTLTLSVPILYIIAILFGAPLTTHHPHTLLLALHLALLTCPPLFYAHGLDAPTWLQIVSLQLPIDEVYGMSLGACVGAWVGAIPIPLDWDREWQKWPVTIIIGLYVGVVVGKVAGGYLFKGMKIKLS